MDEEANNNHGGAVSILGIFVFVALICLICLLLAPSILGTSHPSFLPSAGRPPTPTTRLRLPTFLRSRTDWLCSVPAFKRQPRQLLSVSLGLGLEIRGVTAICLSRIAEEPYQCCISIGFEACTHVRTGTAPAPCCRRRWYGRSFKRVLLEGLKNRSELAKVSIGTPLWFHPLAGSFIPSSALESEPERIQHSLTHARPINCASLPIGYEIDIDCAFQRHRSDTRSTSTAHSTHTGRSLVPTSLSFQHPSQASTPEGTSTMRLPTFPRAPTYRNFSLGPATIALNDKSPESTTRSSGCLPTKHRKIDTASNVPSRKQKHRIFAKALPSTAPHRAVAHPSFTLYLYRRFVCARRKERQRMFNPWRSKCNMMRPEPFDNTLHPIRNVPSSDSSGSSPPVPCIALFHRPNQEERTAPVIAPSLSRSTVLFQHAPATPSFKHCSFRRA